MISIGRFKELVRVWAKSLKGGASPEALKPYHDWQTSIQRIQTGGYATASNINQTVMPMQNKDYFESKSSQVKSSQVKSSQVRNVIALIDSRGRL